MRVKFHFRCFLFDDADTPLSQDWTEVGLATGRSIEIAGRHVSCPSIESLHAITTSAGDLGAAVLCFLGVRLLQTRALSAFVGDLCSITEPSHVAAGSAAAVAKNQLGLEVELLAELEVQVRPGARICPTAEKWPAWRCLLPSLSAYARQEVTASGLQLPPPLQSPTTTSTMVETIRPHEPTRRENTKKALAGHSLEEVYSSLKPQAPQVVVEDGDGRGERPAVGPGPGACGLNALPAAVLIKGKQV